MHSILRTNGEVNIQQDYKKLVKFIRHNQIE